MAVGVGVLEWRLRNGKHKAGRPQATWNVDLRRMAGSRRVRIAEYRVGWRAIAEVYVQQWTDIG